MQNMNSGSRPQPEHRQNDLILAIDLGSSSVRASAYRMDGERLEDASDYRPTEQAVDGTFDPAALTALTEEVISECLARVRRLRGGHRFVAVAWTSFAMSWIGVDGSGRPISPVYTYADTRSGRYADRLRRELEGEGVLESTWRRTGTPIHSAYAPAQLLRLAAEEPERLAQVVHWQTLASHLLARWQGRAFAPVSSSEAGWTGLFNRGSGCWDVDLARRVGLDRSKLPPVNDYTNRFAGLAEPWAGRWPELAQSPFFLAVGDGVGANLGSGCTDNRRIALTIGTTGAMRVVIPTASNEWQGEAGEPLPDRGGSLPEAPTGLWSYPIDRGRWLIGGALTDGGSLYSWLHELLAVEDSGAMLAVAARLTPDSHGLTILPFLRGERAPGWATEATLTIGGMTPATTAAHIIRAAFEAVAFRFRLIYDRLRPHLAPDSVIVASGGALQVSALWRQILADVLQTPMHLVNVDEATSRGAAVLALQALDLPQPPLPPTVHTAIPDRQAGIRYEEALRRQEELYERVVRSP